MTDTAAGLMPSLPDTAASVDHVLLHSLKEHLLYTITDPHGRILELNGNYSRLSGYRAEELIGQPHSIVNGGHHPVAFWVELWAHISAGKTWHGVICNRARDGRPYWVDVLIAPYVDGAGRIDRYVSLQTDITARKVAEESLRISEERHRLLAETARDVVWTMSPAGAITYVSPAVEKVRGYTPEEAMHQTLDQILTPASQAVSLGYFTRMHADLQAGRKPETFRGELEYLCKDGSTYWTEVIVYPVFNDDGSVHEIVGVTRDLSERKRHEAELLAANNELKRHRDHLDELVHERTRELASARDAAEGASRAKSALLANVSHELRTPLNQIAGNAWLLARDVDDATLKARATTIGTAARQLLLQVNDLIDMARLESDEIHIAQAEFALSDLIETTLAPYRETVQQRGLTLYTELDQALPRHVTGDQHRLGQVLRALLDNAIKFSERGEVSVRCRADGLHGERLALRFEIEDQGQGIDGEQARKLFTAFQQGDASSTRQHGGTGLGLALCKRLVGLMAGEIGVDSVPGLGSRFWFTVTLLPGKDQPAGNATAAAATGAAPDADTVAQTVALIDHLTTLLSDDDAHALDIWKTARAPVGAVLGDDLPAFAAALEAYDFPDALEILRKHVR